MSNDRVIPIIHKYRSNRLEVTIGTIRICYSYKTPVIFNSEEREVVVKNKWGVTTGRHIAAMVFNTVPKERDRLDQDEFEKQLNSALAKQQIACLAKRVKGGNQ